MAGDGDAPDVRIVESPGLGATLVPHECHLRVAITLLLKVGVSVLDVPDAAEGAEIVDGRGHAMPCLVGGLAVEGVCWRSVEHVHNRRDRLAPEVAGQLLGHEHAPHHGDDGLVSVFHHPILL